MRITIPDALADQYAAHASVAGTELDATCAKQLTRFAALPPHQKAIVLGGTTLDVLASIFGREIRDGADLLAAVQSLASIEFHRIRLDFRPGQLETLRARAEREGRPVEVKVREVIDAITREFFDTPAFYTQQAPPSTGRPKNDRASAPAEGEA